MPKTQTQVRYRVRKSKETATSFVSTVEVIDDAGKVLHTNVKTIRRKGPLRWDVSALFRQKQEVAIWIRHPCRNLVIAGIDEV